MSDDQKRRNGDSTGERVEDGFKRGSDRATTSPRDRHRTHSAGAQRGTGASRDGSSRPGARGGSGERPSRNRSYGGEGGRDGDASDNRRRRAMADDARYKPEGESPRGATAALIELDTDLMKLLVRRATLVSRIRGGKDHAATPGAIQAEKLVRTAFETNALSFSKDPRFTRQLFTLLQELTVISKEEAKSKPGYTLAPQKEPVRVSIAGPVSGRAARMWIALAACAGKKAEFFKVPRCNAVSDCIKAFSQAGAAVDWLEPKSPLSTVSVVGGAKPSFAGKTLFIGDDALTLYLACFMAVAQTGVTRLTGGASLKSADLSGLRHVLPLLGARLAHVIPRSTGLPATLESSGALPDRIVVPEDLPLEGVCALLLAPLIWNRAFSIDLSALPADVAATALTEVSALFAECAPDVDASGAIVTYQPTELNIPSAMHLPLDPVLCAYLLALPAFAGGTVVLRGSWPGHLPEALESLQILEWAGLHVEVSADVVQSSVRSQEGALLPVMLPDEPVLELVPLLAALFARDTRKGSRKEPFPACGTDLPLAQSFFTQLGLSLDGEVSEAGEGESPAAPAWTCPDGIWGMGLALASFVKSGVRLANPELVSERMPAFWGLFNGLPEPLEPGTIDTSKEKEHAPTTRRRFIAG